MKQVFIFIFLFVFANQVFAQETKTAINEIKTDTMKTSNTIEIPIFSDSVFSWKLKNPIAKKAALYSAIFPGIGQAYNKQYWKLGVVGLGIGASTGFIIFNNSKYQDYKQAYTYRIDNNPSTSDKYIGIYNTSDLKTLQETYRKYLEYTVIATTLGYALNILDAFVSAHLKPFDVSPNLSFKLAPSFNQNQLALSLKIPLQSKQKL